MHKLECRRLWVEFSIKTLKRNYLCTHTHTHMHTHTNKDGSHNAWCKNLAISKKEHAWFMPRYSDIRNARRCWCTLINRPIRTDAVSNWEEEQIQYEFKSSIHKFWNETGDVFANLRTYFILLNTKRNPYFSVTDSIQDA